MKIMAGLKVKKIIIFLLTLFILVSCGNRRQFIEEFERIMDEKHGEQLLNALKDLDKSFPGKLRTKTNIAVIYLSMGKPEQAELFFEKGVNAARRSRERDEKYTFFANYSEYLFSIGNYSESLRMGMAALGAEYSDPSGVSITIAQIFAHENRPNDSILFFKRAWREIPNIFTDQDIYTFFYILSVSEYAEENIALMVSIIEEMRLRNPDIRGYGFKQAEILHQAGAPVSSLIATFSEMEFSRLYTAADNEKMLEAIDLLYENNRESLLSVRIIEGYRNFILEEWHIAETIFAEVTPETPMIFYNYLRLASRLQAGHGTEAMLTTYLQLGRHFSELQGYHFNLWNGIKNSSIRHDPAFMEAILKNCILLSPASDYARLSRIELGRLHDIPQGEKIILHDEVLHYINLVITREATVDILEPVALMLEMEEDNIFIDDIMQALQEAVRERRIGDWFRNRAQRGNENIRARISVILS